MNISRNFCLFKIINLAKILIVVKSAYLSFRKIPIFSDNDDGKLGLRRNNSHKSLMPIKKL